MPSIAQQDFKIYGDIGFGAIVPGSACAELYSAIIRARENKKATLALCDSFVYDSEGGTARVLNVSAVSAVYFDSPDGEMASSFPTKTIEYYDALWALQSAECAVTQGVLAVFEYKLHDGILTESEETVLFITEDGYPIMGTESDGKLASLYVGSEKYSGEDPVAVVRIEDLLPLVGVLPLETSAIF